MLKKYFYKMHNSKLKVINDMNIFKKISIKIKLVSFVTTSIKILFFDINTRKKIILSVIAVFFVMFLSGYYLY